MGNDKSENKEHVKVSKITTSEHAMFSAEPTMKSSTKDIDSSVFEKPKINKSKDDDKDD